jgi:hypothetical protein
VEDLVSRWRDELARAGYPPVELAAAVEREALAYQPPGMDVLDRVADELLAPGGRLSQEKTFSRSDVIVVVAPCCTACLSLSWTGLLTASFPTSRPSRCHW